MAIMFQKLINEASGVLQPFGASSLSPIGVSISGSPT
jgi:hypothetical protein